MRMYNNYSVLIASSIMLLVASCSPDNIKRDNSLKKHFDENKVEGCFALMNNATGKFTVYNFERYRDSAYLPASTFKIVNSLIGLQTGKIVNDSMVIKWDGQKRWNEDWNKDLNMYDAFRLSAVPYYQEVARRIGKDTMQYWLDSLKYGAQSLTALFKIKSPVDSFWLDNTLKITPDQQLGLVKKLYFNELPFFKVNQEMVKNAMLFENKTTHRLGYKTGWGVTPKNHALGWVVGWIEENNHPYFFVLNIESANNEIDLKTVRMKMLKNILTQLGFFKDDM